MKHFFKEFFSDIAGPMILFWIVGAVISSVLLLGMVAAVCWIVKHFFFA